MKPQPKKEIVVKTYEQLANRLEIYCASQDALNWIFAEAPQFGQLLDLRESTGEIVLHINPLYDPAEVQKYLETQDQADD